MAHARAATVTTLERSLRQRLPEALLILIVAGLCLFGALTLFSIGRAHQSDSTELLVRQATWAIMALVAMLITLRIRFSRLRDFTWMIAGASLLLLILVLVPGIGSKINGARRWIDLGVMHMQVSDFAKVGFVFTLAHYLAAQQRRLGEFRIGYLVPVGIIGAVFGLLILQPDYGTAVLFAAVGALLLFLAGARMSYLIPTGLLGVAAFTVLVLIDPVRLERVTSFLDHEANRADGGYQLWQGMLAFGAGGVQGVGLSNGRQPLTFLPEAHTDFIFAVIGEELGLVCTAAIVGLFILFFILVALQLRKAPNIFEFLLVTGALLFIVLQALINFGVVTGLLPTKGMSLPFISYGGSNLVVMFVFVGIILNCLSEWNRGVETHAREING